MLRCFGNTPSFGRSSLPFFAAASNKVSRGGCGLRVSGFILHFLHLCVVLSRLLQEIRGTQRSMPGE
jgi:hypothetical protein